MVQENLICPNYFRWFQTKFPWFIWCPKTKKGPHGQKNLIQFFRDKGKKPEQYLAAQRLIARCLKLQDYYRLFKCLLTTVITLS